MKKIIKTGLIFSLIASALMASACNGCFPQTPSTSSSDGSSTNASLSESTSNSSWDSSFDGSSDSTSSAAVEGVFDQFNVPASVEVNYNEVFAVPQIVVVHGAQVFSAEISVFQRSNGEEVDVSGGDLLVSDFDGYVVRYYATNGSIYQTKEMLVNVADNAAPVITFDGISDAKVYTKKATTYAIPVEKVKVSDNLSNAKVTYKVFKDGQQVVVSNDTLNVSETGEYDVVFYATDANGNVAEKTLKVYAVDCDENMYLDFETAWDTDKIYGNNYTGNYLNVSRVSYDDWDIAKPTDGGNYGVLMRPILNATYPRYYIDFGQTLPAGTKVSYSMYFEAHETPKKMFTVEGAENCMITTKDYKHNEWITIEGVLTANTRYISSYLHLALLDGFDTPAYNYPAGIKVFLDNVSVETVDDSYYSEEAMMNMIRGHIYNDSTKSYVSVSYENCAVGEYTGMAFKMDVPTNNKILFDADLMAFLKVYAAIHNYTNITANVYATAGEIALNTWTIESLPPAGTWYTQEKTIATLSEYFYILRNNPGTVYMYFEFA